uniref:Uncharacterized protein n=1 Tax=Brassica oleracea TaxID=3712 RepID=A0A3P6DC97_BRAOL|nr:unnamed protein product [Brassica oleracea]
MPRDSAKTPKFCEYSKLASQKLDLGGALNTTLSNPQLTSTAVDLLEHDYPREKRYAATTLAHCSVSALSMETQAERLEPVDSVWLCQVMDLSNIGTEIGKRKAMSLLELLRKAFQ